MDGGILDTVTDLIPGKKGIVSKLFNKFGGKAGGKAAGNLLSKFSGKAGGKVLGKLGGKIGGKLLARGATGALKAIPGVGLLATAGMAAFDAYKGWNNAGQITGKKQKDLTTRDKAQAATASALSGLTFGLVSSQTMYKGVNAVTSGIGKAATYMNNMSKSMMKGIGKGVGKAWNWLTKPSQKGGKTGAQKIGSIGKKLFNMTPLGMGLNFLSKKLNGDDKKQQEKLLAQKKQFTQKVIPSAIMSGINSSQFGKLFVKTLSTKDHKKQPIPLSLKIRENEKTGSSLQGLSNSLAKMEIAEAEKVKRSINLSQQKNNERRQTLKNESEKLQVFPEIIRRGIAAYFSHAKLNVQTGKFQQDKQQAKYANALNDFKTNG